MDTRLEAVIFDLGRVMIDFDHRIAAQKVMRYSDKGLKEAYELFFDSNITGLFEEGKISPEDFFLKVKEMLNLNLEYRDFLPIWNEIFIFSDNNRQVYDIARALKKKYKLALLSNINVLHFDYIKNKFPVFSVFDLIVTSYETGTRKPDPAIYHKVISLLNVAPENIFYTDDRPELIQGAALLGIRSYCFENPAKLKKDLIASGVQEKLIC